MAAEIRPRSFVVVIQPSVEGGFVAGVPALPGCFTQGDTLEQVRERVKEAILLTLEDMQATGTLLPEPVLVEQITVESPV